MTTLTLTVMQDGPKRCLLSFDLLASSIQGRNQNHSVLNWGYMPGNQTHHI